MKELDVLLSRYLDEEYATATAADRQAFRELLECPDPAIYAYFLGQQAPNPVISALVDRIMARSPNDR